MLKDAAQVRVGAVAIGRNEGERLRRCLDSLVGRVDALVYVDSGSTDGSAEMARNKGVEVVELDMSVPFTMARGRNAGYERLMARYPEVERVQFVDGDCEVDSRWIATAMATLDARPDVAAVCGRRRERHPEASVYNLLCDMEWNTPVGEVKACGGDVLVRVEAIRQAGAYRPDLIVGEEAEFCMRLRAKGWKILRLPDEMTLHDAAITRFPQWWKRTVRTGYAYAEGAALFGSTPERHLVKRRRSALIWGCALPLLALMGAVASAWFAPLGLVPILVAAMFGGLMFRVWRYRLSRGDRPETAFWLALFQPPTKVAQCVGVARYWRNRRLGRQAQLIEYKQPTAPAGA